MRILLTLMVLLSVAVGCNRKVVSSVTTEVSDSVNVREIPRIVEVPIPGDTVEILTVIECDSNTNKPKPVDIRNKSGRAGLHLKVNSSGELKASAVCDSLMKHIEARDREINRLRSEKKAETIVQTVYKTRQVDVICRWFTAIGTILLIGAVFIKLKKLVP